MATRKRRQFHLLGVRRPHRAPRSRELGDHRLAPAWDSFCHLQCGRLVGYLYGTNPFEHTPSAAFPSLGGTSPEPHRSCATGVESLHDDVERRRSLDEAKGAAWCRVGTTHPSPLTQRSAAHVTIASTSGSPMGCPASVPSAAKPPSVWRALPRTALAWSIEASRARTSASLSRHRT